MDSITAEAGKIETINVEEGNQFLLQSSKIFRHSFLCRIVSTKILAEKSKIRDRRKKHRSFRQQPSLYRMVLNRILAKKLGINPKKDTTVNHRSRRSTLYTKLLGKVRKSELWATSEGCLNERLFRTNTFNQELSKTTQNSSFDQLFETCSFTEKNFKNEVDLRKQNLNSENPTTHWRKKILLANSCTFVASESSEKAPDFNLNGTTTTPEISLGSAKTKTPGLLVFLPDLISNIYEKFEENSRWEEVISTNTSTAIENSITRDVQDPNANDTYITLTTVPNNTGNVISELSAFVPNTALELPDNNLFGNPLTGKSSPSAIQESSDGCTRVKS